MKYKGFTITELMIAMALSVTLTLVMSVAFISLSRSSRQIQQLAQLQQNAQLVAGLFQNELVNSGFWGGLARPELAANMVLPSSPENDCVASDIDSGSFPALDKNFITLYARKISSSKELGCISSAVKGSELLQLKRLVGQRFDNTALQDNRFFLETDWDYSRIVDVASSGKMPSFSYYPYQHVVFYIQNQQIDGIEVPVLMRKRLIRNAAGKAVMSTDSILDGVERMHFEFSFDNNMDGNVNYQLPTAQISDVQWQQQKARIIGVKFHLLLRSTQPDPTYTNHQQYKLGAEEFKVNGDHYRRLLVSSSVILPSAIL